MSLPRKTPQAARALGISYQQLIGMIRTGKVPVPMRDGSGDFLWYEEDLERVREARRTMKRLVHA